MNFDLSDRFVSEKVVDRYMAGFVLKNFNSQIKNLQKVTKRRVCEACSSAKGSASWIFALSLIPILGVGGAAVDFSRFMSIHKELQLSVDAAVLAAARQLSADGVQQKFIASNSLNSNFKSQFSDAQITDVKFEALGECNPKNSAVTQAVCMSVEIKYNTYILGVIGISEMSGTAYAEATIETNPMEIVFGFDSTGSMNFGSRWEDAKNAMENMLDVLKASSVNAGPDSFRVGLVPFSDRVKIPSSMNGVIDPTITLKKSGPLKYSFRGCIEPREESVSSEGATNPFFLSDKAPSETKFTPTQEGYYGPIYGNVSGDPKPDKVPVCLNAAVVPLTSDVEAVRKELDKLNRKGTGRFDIGAAWVWRLMSPNWRTYFGDPVWPKNYVSDSGRENVKVAVIITDGNTTAYEYEVWVDGDNGGNRKPWGYNNGTPRGFQNFTDVCNRMTNAGVHVHMIFVAKSGINTKFLPYAKDCASEPEYFHLVDDADALIDAFNRIGELSSDLRISR